MDIADATDRTWQEDAARIERQGFARAMLEDLKDAKKDIREFVAGRLRAVETSYRLTYGGRLVDDWIQGKRQPDMEVAIQYNAEALTDCWENLFCTEALREIERDAAGEA